MRGGSLFSPATSLSAEPPSRHCCFVRTIIDDVAKQLLLKSRLRAQDRPEAGGRQGVPAPAGRDRSPHRRCEDSGVDRVAKPCVRAGTAQRGPRPGKRKRPEIGAEGSRPRRRESPAANDEPPPERSSPPGAPAPTFGQREHTQGEELRGDQSACTSVTVHVRPPFPPHQKQRIEILTTVPYSLGESQRFGLEWARWKP